VVVDEEGEVFTGLAVDCFVADQGADGDDADGEGCGEGGEVEEAGGARRGLEGENQDDEGEAGSGDQSVTGLDVGVVGDIEEGHDQGPEEEDPAGEGKAAGGRGLSGSGVGGGLEGRGDSVLQGAADGGGPQQEIEDSGEEAAQDQREAERVDGEETVEDGVGGAGALGGVGVGQEMSEGVERVECPEREWSGEQEQTCDEG
jgi:hypothetical protein